jgi:hypothetical protein
MGQKLFTKNYGEVEVERSWQEGQYHIAKLTNGAYCDITGRPIYDKAELRAVLKGQDLEDALHWFDHRHETEEQPPRRIMFDADGTPIFEDGTPVESPSDLYQALKPGPVLDAAIEALTLKKLARREAERLAQQSQARKKASTTKGSKKPQTKKPAAAKQTKPKAPPPLPGPEAAAATV